MEFRSPTDNEIELLTYLLDRSFPGSEELLNQARSCLVREVAEYTDSNLSLEFALPAEAPASHVRRRIPVEASYLDASGGRVHILLHVVEGRLSELEFWRDDGANIASRPLLSQLTVEINQS